MIFTALIFPPITSKNPIISYLAQLLSSLKNLVSLKNLSPKNYMVKAKNIKICCNMWCKYLEPICRTKRSILSGNRSGTICLQTVNSVIAPYCILALKTL